MGRVKEVGPPAWPAEAGKRSLFNVDLDLCVECAFVKGGVAPTSLACWCWSISGVRALGTSAAAQSHCCGAVAM